jgi:hypothetical protein
MDVGGQSLLAARGSRIPTDIRSNQGAQCLHQHRSSEPSSQFPPYAFRGALKRVSLAKYGKDHMGQAKGDAGGRL